MKFPVSGILFAGWLWTPVRGTFVSWGVHSKDRRWTPAEQTQDGPHGLQGTNLKPTGEALGYQELFKRENGPTCGYGGGDPGDPYYCVASTAGCFYESSLSVIGCCPTASASTTCKFETTCYDSTDSKYYSTDNGYTRFCGESSRPHCWLWEFQASPGYTAWDCQLAAGTGTLFATPTDTSASSTIGTTHVKTPSTTTEFSSTSSTTSTTTSTSTSTSTTSPVPTPVPGPDTNVGAIVGGVVGGVALIALIILGIFFYRRRSQKRATEKDRSSSVAVLNSNDPGASAGTPGTPAGAWSQAGSSPSTFHPSPPPGHPPDAPKGFDSAYHAGFSPARPPTGPYPYDQDGFYQAQRMNSPSAATELSTGRPDREIRELAG